VNKIVTFCLWDKRRKRLILEALLLPAVIWAAVRVVGVIRTMRFLRRWALSGRNSLSSESPVAIIAAARQAQIIVRKNTGMGGTCLIRSLTLWALLLKSRLESNIQVGVRNTDGKIEGHAWVEYGGRPLNEHLSVVETYTQFADALSFDRMT
jgi:hypothetical protein